MITETPIFENGTYNKSCSLFKEIKIGSVLCTGKKDLGIQKCKYCISYKEENSYYLPILKENTPIVSEVICNRPGKQISLF
jgi:hypothetical protein